MLRYFLFFFASRGDFFLRKKEAKKRPLKDNESTKDNFIDSATPLRTDW